MAAIERIEDTEVLRKLLRIIIGVEADALLEEELAVLLAYRWVTDDRLRRCKEQDLRDAGLRAESARIIVTKLSTAAAGPGPSREAASEIRALCARLLLPAVKIDESPSELACMSDWHKYAHWPPSYEDYHSRAGPPTRIGFLTGIFPPANIPPELVSPAFRCIIEAVHAPAEPPPDLVSRADLYMAVRELLCLGSAVYEDEVQGHDNFLKWHNKRLKAGTLVRPPSTSRVDVCPPKHDGMRVTRCNGKDFIVALKAPCKSRFGADGPLMQAIRHYQEHYKGGARWQSDAIYRADPLPALVLLLEGPCLSIHAVWTMYQDLVGYAPLTPSYYLVDEFRDTTNLWKLLAVLAAYEKAVQELADACEEHCRLTDAALDRTANLRKAAQEVEGLVVPCTLPYSLLDEQLGLTDIRFHGPIPHLVYTARQRVDGGVERRVLIKFVKRPYGEEVHRAWHAAGVAPQLCEVQQVGGSMLMVVMELLSPEDGWVPLVEALQDGPEHREPIKQAVRRALLMAHAAPVGESGHKAVHGDMRRPNIFVRRPHNGAGDMQVSIIDFDWAGRDGEATYPLVLLARDPAWHPDVRPGAIMRQKHDWFLLKSELGDQD